jgi:hypothetical protein
MNRCDALGQRPRAMRGGAPHRRASSVSISPLVAPVVSFMNM